MDNPNLLFKSVELYCAIILDFQYWTGILARNQGIDESMYYWNGIGV
jgi:hypothetical protein